MGREGSFKIGFIRGNLEFLATGYFFLVPSDPMAPQPHDTKLDKS
jgi:hypothetical protein